MEKRKMSRTEKIAYTALLVAMQVVLGNLLQIPLLSKQFHFGFLPIAVAGAVFGPVAAMLVGGLGDFLGAHLFPAGAYFVGFTLSNILAGLLYGLILYRHKLCFWRCASAVLAVSLCYLFLNSYWLNVVVPTRSYWVWVGMRWWTYLIEIPLNTVVCYFAMQLLSKFGLHFPVAAEAAHRSA